MRLITLTGTSGVGKDLIVKSTIKMIPELIPIISHTTRPMRKGESQDREYHFIDTDTARDMLNNGEFIETRQYYVANEETWLYGIHKSEIDLDSDDKYIAVVDFQGLHKIEKFLMKNNCIESLTSIFIDADYQVRLKRSLDREGKMSNDQVKEVIRRFQDDIQFVEPAKDYCNLYLENNNVDDLLNIINKIKEELN